MEKHNKLVRDKIPEIIKKNGDKFKAHTADEEEYWQKLKEKLLEETYEFFEEENKEELADVFEVIQAISKARNWDVDDIIKIQKAKREKRGGFDKKIILDES